MMALAISGSVNSTTIEDARLRGDSLVSHPTKDILALGTIVWLFARICWIVVFWSLTLIDMVGIPWTMTPYVGIMSSMCSPRPRIQPVLSLSFVTSTVEEVKIWISPLLG